VANRLDVERAAGDVGPHETIKVGPLTFISTTG